jgi:hypothetical protein
VFEQVEIERSKRLLSEALSVSSVLGQQSFLRSEHMIFADFREVSYRSGFTLERIASESAP